MGALYVAPASCKRLEEKKNASSDVIYYSDETRLMSYNVQTAEQIEVRDFADDFPGQNLGPPF
jgi:hypothetical protein